MVWILIQDKDDAREGCQMKIEDCKYCTKNDCSFGEDFNVKGLGVSANIMFSDNYYAIYIVTESSDGLMEINYCPMCGRNLYED